VGFQCSATSSVIARLRSFRSRRTRTWHKFKIEVIGPHKLAKSARSLSSQFAFGVAGGATGFWGVESDKPHVWFLVMNTDRVAVDDVNICGIYWRGNGQSHRHEQSDKREHARHRISGSVN